jgi:hypothetical protein
MPAALAGQPGDLHDVGRTGAPINIAGHECRSLDEGPGRPSSQIVPIWTPGLVMAGDPTAAPIGGYFALGTD